MIQEPGAIRMLRVKLSPELQKMAVGHYGCRKKESFGWDFIQVATIRHHNSYRSSRISVMAILQIDFGGAPWSLGAG